MKAITRKLILAQGYDVQVVDNNRMIIPLAK